MFNFHAPHSFRAVYEKLQPFVIGGNKIECVTGWSHLGRAINTQLTEDDVAACKSQLIGQMRLTARYATFSKLDPVTKKPIVSSLLHSFLWMPDLGLV